MDGYYDDEDDESSKEIKKSEKYAKRQERREGYVKNNKKFVLCNNPMEWME